MSNKWVTFLAERFPLSSHVPMIAAFTFGNVALVSTFGDSSLTKEWPVDWSNSLIAFLVAVSFFLRLRLFDEIKDYETDLRVNPSRPLARGLVTIFDLKLWIIFLCGFELAIVSVVGPRLLIIHALAMAYSFMMYREFFVGALIRPHLTTYAVMHTFVSVLVGLSVASIGMGSSVFEGPKEQTILFLVNWALFNLFEFARKTFAPEEERENVESYSKLFAPWGAALLSISQVLGAVALLWHLGVGFSALSFLVMVPAAIYALRPIAKTAKIFRALSSVYLVLAYVAIGVLLMMEGN